MDNLDLYHWLLYVCFFPIKKQEHFFVNVDFFNFSFCHFSVFDLKRFVKNNCLTQAPGHFIKSKKYKNIKKCSIYVPKLKI